MKWETKQGKKPFWETGSQKHRKDRKPRWEDAYITTHRLLTKFDHYQFELYRDAVREAVDRGIVDRLDLLVTEDAIYGWINKDFTEFWKLFDEIEPKHGMKSRSDGISVLFILDSLTTSGERMNING